MAWYRCVGGAGGSLKLRTASGRIASFSTNMVEAFKSLKSDINPVQDLHGYDKPWSGGGGKNKLNYDVWKTTGVMKGTAIWENNGVTLTATGNDCYTLTSTDAKIPMSEGETITLSWEETTNKSGQIFIFPNGTTTGMVTVNNGAVKKATYTATSGVTFVTFRFGVTNNGDTIAYKNIQIEKGSQATSWEPYSNICPISGFSALTVMRTGVNLWDEQWELGGIGPDGTDLPNTERIRSKNFIHIKPNLSVFIHLSDSRTVSFYVCEYDINKTFIQRTINNKNAVFTTSANCYFIRFFIYSAGNPITTYGNNISINYPSTDTTYHAYNGQTKTVNFGQTVYGGVADVTGGKANKTYDIVDLGTFNWISEDSSLLGLARVNPVQVTPLGAKYMQTPICTQYKGVYSKGYTLFNNGEIAFSNSEQFPMIRARSTEFVGKTNEQIKALMSGVMLCYELATPIEITTTPENLTAIVGQNNVYGDTNGDTEVKYLYRE